MKLDWSKLLRRAELRGWQIKQLAAAAGVSPQSLSDIKWRRNHEPLGTAAVILFLLDATKALPGDATAMALASQIIEGDALGSSMVAAANQVYDDCSMVRGVA